MTSPTKTLAISVELSVALEKMKYRENERVFVGMSHKILGYADVVR